MATYDYPRELVQGLDYPCPERQSLHIDRWRAAPPAEEEKLVRARSDANGKVPGDIFYFVEPRPRNSWATLGSFGLLSILISALILVPLFHIDPLPKRETLTMLYLQPPAAAGSTGMKLRVPRSKPTYVPSTNGISAPRYTKQEAQPVPVDTNGGVIDGVPGGVIGGVAGGTLSGVLGTTSNVPVLAKAPEPTQDKRIRVPTRVAEANLIHDVPPQYPPEAGRARIEGKVVLMAVIGRDGTVKDLRVESGLPILAQAAIDAVKQWRYKPYLIDGEPVEVDSRITINFTLSVS